MHVLFAFFTPPYSGFASSISPYDTTSRVAWKVHYDSLKAQLMRLFMKIGSRLEVPDTASAVEQIGGRTFQRFYIKTFTPESEVTLQTYWYALPYHSYDLSINLAYADEATGQTFLEILRQSTFEPD